MTERRGQSLSPAPAAPRLLQHSPRPRGSRLEGGALRSSVGAGSPALSSWTGRRAPDGRHSAFGTRRASRVGGRGPSVRSPWKEVLRGEPERAVTPRWDAPAAPTLGTSCDRPRSEGKFLRSSQLCCRFASRRARGRWLQSGVPVQHGLCDQKEPAPALALLSRTFHLFRGRIRRTFLAGTKSTQWATSPAWAS